MSPAAFPHTIEVQKRVFAGPMWVVLLGLEGTGHHGVCESLLPRCGLGDLKADLTGRTRELGILGAPCVALDGHMQLLVRRLVFAAPQSLRHSRAALQRRLRSYGNLSDTYRLLFQCTSSADSIYPSFMMSYPDAELGMLHAMPEEGKVTAHADAVALAQAAEAASVDVRFVVLRRDPADAAASVSRRTTVPFSAAARILRDNDAVLEWQLRRMSSAFIYELHYEALDPSGLAHFLKLNASELADNFRLHFHPTSQTQGDVSSADRAFVRYLWR